MAADVKPKRVKNKRTVERGVTNTMLKECWDRTRREQNHACLEMLRHFILGKHELRCLFSVETNQNEVERGRGILPEQLPSWLTS